MRADYDFLILQHLVICGRTLAAGKSMSPASLWRTFRHVCANQIKTLFTLHGAYWAIAVRTQGVVALQWGMRRSL